jgi:hypothetical protein
VLRRAVLVAVLSAAAWLPVPATARAALPTVDYTLSGTTGDNGWYRGAVTVAWAVEWNGTPVASSGCEPAVPLTADTTGVALTCRAENTEGLTTARTKVIKIDQRPPVVTGAAPSRPPDAGGWYRAAVGVAWSGTDTTSGISTCTSLTHAGPDGPASLPGSCRDAAGNVSPDLPFALRYDSTAPKLSAVTAAGGDTVATVRWQTSSDAAVTIMRSPGGRSSKGASMVYSGRSARFEDIGLRNRARYAYTVVATDAAGNAASVTAVARTGSRLRGPRPGARVTVPPVLRWASVRGATYYNVQLYRGKRKVHSVWPSRPEVRLERVWRYGGHRGRLTAGMYRWYVWPGYGERSQRRYGRLLGTRRFAVIRPPAR